ncbi:hypothetical protein [Methylomonas koyamae]|nr:hypothetical protein [Methylomonas koyamae]
MDINYLHGSSRSAPHLARNLPGFGAATRLSDAAKLAEPTIFLDKN